MASPPADADSENRLTLQGATVGAEPGAGGETVTMKGAEILGFRKALGFSLPEWVDPSTTYRFPTATLRYGVPLSALEVAEVDRRVAFQQSLDAVNEILDSHKDAVAGSYLDHEHDGRLVVLLTDASTAALRSAIERSVPEGRVDFRSARYSRALLEEAQARLEANLGDLQRRGVAVVTIGIDEMANRVAVGLTDVRPADAEVIGQIVDVSLLRLEQSGAVRFLGRPE